LSARATEPPGPPSASSPNCWATPTARSAGGRRALGWHGAAARTAVPGLVRLLADAELVEEVWRGGRSVREVRVRDAAAEALRLIDPDAVPPGGH
jgi:hypothetical protein